MEKSKRIQGEKSSSCTSYRIVCIRLGMFTIFSSGRIKVEEKGPVNGKKCLKSMIFANYEYEINCIDLVLLETKTLELETRNSAVAWYRCLRLEIPNFCA